MGARQKPRPSSRSRILWADSYPRLMADVQRGVYLGIHEAAGVPGHHLSFEQATIDWQLWIDAGTEPLPRKLVITYETRTKSGSTR